MLIQYNAIKEILNLSSGLSVRFATILIRFNMWETKIDYTKKGNGFKKLLKNIYQLSRLLNMFLIIKTMLH